MNIAVIIPDRNDRPKFTENCFRMIQNQTIQPDQIFKINFSPTDEKPDITKRYRIGYDLCRNKGFDVIALMENDDWYSPDYLEIMTKAWNENGRPDIFGTNYTIYYHLQLHKYFTMNHKRRSSAMSTLIKPDLNFQWCPDHEVYTDLHIWQTLSNRVTFQPDKHICIGMKHGIGKCGGRNHKDKLDRYINSDGLRFLGSNLDRKSFDFYTSVFG